MLAVTSLAQPKKYQSLLWEISGNGLSKNSYLYGSMHVSEKVSYHLSDAFFTHLLASDYVANESDPATWISLYDIMGMGNSNNYLYASNGFYSQFYQQPIKRDDLFPLFVSHNNIMNNLLFRTSENQKDYQEDTYLDMFIYQTGKKYKKQVVGLENAKTSMLSVMGAETGDLTPREENIQAIMKLLKDKPFNQALLDYYRDKNLDMLDSLYTLATPDVYYKALILDRNQVMAKSIDSIARNGSLFAAVGAAHLPGKKGVIELLRQKGYTVTPVLDAYTQKGRSVKKQIDEYFIKPNFESRQTTDGMIRLPMHAQPIYSANNIDTPDLANGGVINLKRIPLRDYLRKDNHLFSAKTLDSLFYENIPGEILEKRYFTDENAVGFDIKSRTKTGNTQHYKYYITPIEVICVSMSGNGNYVRQYENEIFPNIRLKKPTAAWETISPVKGGFSLDVPAYYALYGNRDSSNPENIELNAWDDAEKSWFFLTERTLDDTSQLEETAFELKRIQDEFYTQFDALTSVKEIAKSSNSYQSESKIGSNTICLKTIVIGQKYYLMGTVKASAQNTNRFFGSFAPKPFHYQDVTKRYADSLGRYSIEIPVKQNEKLFWQLKEHQPVLNGYEEEMQNRFDTFEKQVTFTSASGKTVWLSAWENHRYDYERNRDSLLTTVKKRIYADLNLDNAAPMRVGYGNNAPVYYLNSFDRTDPNIPDSTWDDAFAAVSEARQKSDPVTLTGEKINYDELKKTYVLDLTAQKQSARQAIRYKIFIRDGYTWCLRTLLDPDDDRHDVFLEKTARSFTPDSSRLRHSIFDKKTDLFFEDARSENDTIRFSALESAYRVDFEKADLEKLKDFILNFDFRPDETDATTLLLERIGAIEDPSVLPFLESCYKKDPVNTALQLSVIKGLAAQKSKSAYKKILELLEYDLPLPSNKFEITALFNDFATDIENSKALFPEILQFYGVEEYREPVARFIAHLFTHNSVHPNKAKSYRKILLTDARLEYKRVTAWKLKNENPDSFDGFYATSPVATLSLYCDLLFPFKNDKAIAQWFEKVSALEITDIDLELLRLRLADGVTPNASAITRLLTDKKTKFTTYRLLRDYKQAVPAWTDEDTAQAVAEGFGITQGGPYELTALATRELTVNGLAVTVFFFDAKSTEKQTLYGMPENKLLAVGFLHNKDEIDPKAWKVLAAQPLPDATAIDAQIAAILDRLLNAGHSRASFGKQKTTNFPTGYLEEEF